MHISSANGVAAAIVPTVPFGWLAYLGAGASLFVCYGKVTILAAISAFGIHDIGFNPHLQAVLMWSLGLVALYGLYSDRRLHQKNYPLVLGIAGVAIIMATLYTHYESTIEMSGYILLVVAALLNQNARLFQLHREVQAQAHVLSTQAGELSQLNQNLEQRVTEQVDEIDKLARLKRFLAPEVAKIVLTERGDSMLQSHRSYIVTLFCDIRGFTRFSETMEPEEVMDVLQSFHQCMGRLAAEHGGTIDHRAGDGLMIFFNDPLPCDEPELTATRMALSMREQFADLNREWKKHGYDLGLGIGIASGYATLGLVGDEDRFDYTANGNVVNLASRLCDEADDGQILINHRMQVALESRVEVEKIGELQLKGLGKPAPAYDLKRLVDQAKRTPPDSG